MRSRTNQPWPVVAVVLALLGILLPVALDAQWHDQGYIATSGDAIYRFTPSGEARLREIASNQWDATEVQMDRDNRLALVVLRNRATILRVDPDSLATVGTLISGAPLVKPEAIAVDHHGDYLISDSGAKAIFRLALNGQLSTVAIDPRFDRVEGGLRIDPDTGDLLVMNTGVDDTLYRLWWNARVTTVGTKFNGRFGFDVDLASADVFSASCCSPPHLTVLRLAQPSASQFVLTAPAPTGYYALRADRASTQDPRLVVSPTGSNGGIWYVNLTSRVVTPLQVVGQTLYSIDHLGGRNVQTRRVASGRWEVHLDFPGQGGNGFHTLVSATGIRPGLFLNDSRRLSLAIDDLTRFTMWLELPGIWWNNRGVLDATGHAVTHLSTRPLGQALHGVRLYFCAVTFDPAAPLGIRTIADPVVLLLD